MKITRNKLRRLILESLHNLPGNGKPYIPPFDLNELLKDQGMKWSMQYDTGDPSAAALGHEGWVEQVDHGLSLLGEFLFEYDDLVGMQQMMRSIGAPVTVLPSVQEVYQDALNGTYSLLIDGQFHRDHSWYIRSSEALKQKLASTGFLPQQFVDLM